MMHAIGLFAACLACAGQGRRVQNQIKQFQGRPLAEMQRSLKEIDTITNFHSLREANQSQLGERVSADGNLDPREALAKLFGAAQPVALFSPSGPGARIATSNPKLSLSHPTVSGLRHPVMQAPRTMPYNTTGVSPSTIQKTAVLDVQEVAEKVQQDLKKMRAESERRAQKAADHVKSDLEGILRVQPDWSKYSDDLQVTDAKGNIMGLSAIRKLMGLMRKFVTKCVEKDRVNVQTRLIHGDDPKLLAKGTVMLRSKAMFFPIPLPPFTLNVEGSSSIHFNKEGKVSRIAVNSLVFNGRPIEFPRVSWQGSAGKSDDFVSFKKLSIQDQMSLSTWVRKVILGC